MASLSLLVSCSDTTTNDPPTLTLTSPQQASMQVGKGEVVPIQLTALYNLNSKSSLVKVTIVANYSAGGSTQVLDSLVPKAVDNQISILKMYTVPMGAAEGTIITVVCKVVDKAGLSDEKTFTLTVANMSDVTEYQQFNIGAQANKTLGSTYATDSGKVYMIAAAKARQTGMDFIYFYDDAQGFAHSLAAPDDAVLGSVTTLVSTWTAKNATRFKETTMTSAEYDAITTSTPIKQRYDASSKPELTKAPNLAAGSFFVFKTSKTKYGIVQVVSINEASVKKESSMALKVKIQNK